MSEWHALVMASMNCLESVATYQLVSAGEKSDLRGRSTSLTFGAATSAALASSTPGSRAEQYFHPGDEAGASSRDKISSEE